MRKRFPHWIVLICVIMMITACNANSEAPVEGGQESSSLDEAYPSQGEAVSEAEGAYPAQNEVISQAREAYPVVAADLQVLEGSWLLSTYSEDSAAMETPLKTITFVGDSYEIVTDEGRKTGTWTAQVDSYYPILILDPESEAALTYEIVALNESVLKLRTVNDQITIEEEYLPVD